MDPGAPGDSRPRCRDRGGSGVSEIRSKARLALSQRPTGPCLPPAGGSWPPPTKAPERKHEEGESRSAHRSWAICRRGIETRELYRLPEPAATWTPSRGTPSGHLVMGRETGLAVCERPAIFGITGSATLRRKLFRCRRSWCRPGARWQSGTELSATDESVGPGRPGGRP
jgi:hypothetical protein